MQGQQYNPARNQTEKLHILSPFSSHSTHCDRCLLFSFIDILQIFQEGGWVESFGLQLCHFYCCSQWEDKKNERNYLATFSVSSLWMQLSVCLVKQPPQLNTSSLSLSVLSVAPFLSWLADSNSTAAWLTHAPVINEHNMEPRNTHLLKMPQFSSSLILLAFLLVKVRNSCASFFNVLGRNTWNAVLGSPTKTTCSFSDQIVQRANINSPSTFLGDLTLFTSLHLQI